MSQIASTLPIDANQKAIAGGNLVGAVLAKTYDATISSASDITLQAGTTSFEVLAIDKAVFVRFAASASSTNFDAVVGANQTKVFYRDPAVTVISIIEASATGGVAVIEK